VGLDAAVLGDELGEHLAAVPHQLLPAVVDPRELGRAPRLVGGAREVEHVEADLGSAEAREGHGAKNSFGPYSSSSRSSVRCDSGTNLGSGAWRLRAEGPAQANEKKKMFGDRSRPPGTVVRPFGGSSWGSLPPRRYRRCGHLS